MVRAESLSVKDIDDKAYTPLQMPGQKASVLLFITHDCPIANAYAPEIKRICTDYQLKGVSVFVVYVDPSLSAEQARKHAAEFGYTCPQILDAAHTLVKTLSARTTPEAFVVSPDGKTLYRGRIDDRYITFGKSRGEPTQRDLRQALDEVLAGKAVTTASTEAVGCFIDTTATASSQPVTFNKDIAPIVYRNCAVCHHAGEVAPFTLTSFDDVKKRAKQIGVITEMRVMPPWKAEPGFGEFRDERRLSDAEIAKIQAWVAGGAVEGDAADKIEPQKYSEGWQLGEPDLIVKMPEGYTVAAEGRDVFRCFVLPLNLDEDKYVRAVEYRPSNRTVVHHALFFLDTSGAARKKDEADPGPGFSSFGGPGFLPSGGLGGWAPGAMPEALPDGMARLLKKGSDLVIQTHFHPTGKPEIEQSTVGIYFAKKKPDRIVTGVSLSNRNIDIPAGKSDYKISATFTTPVDIDVVGLAPHAHLVCKDMKANAELPDGTKKPLIWIKDWDFNWQGEYQYLNPVKLPKGTVITMDYIYDNSKENTRNPNNPPQEVKFGEQTTNEMAFLFMQVVTEDPKDLPKLRLAMLGQLLKNRFERAKESAKQDDAKPDGAAKAADPQKTDNAK